jgi:hypothetical protein
MWQHGLYAAQAAGNIARSMGRRRRLYAQEQEREGSGAGDAGAGGRDGARKGER